MKILIAGASGLIGTALSQALRARGDEVFTLVRHEAATGANKIFWKPEAQQLDRSRVEGFDVFINLAGENIAQRWTTAAKSRLRSSRIDTTLTLANAICELKSPPRVWFNASAIGIYGDRGSEELTENSGAGTGFLAELGQEWETSTSRAAAHGVRVVLGRFGVVLNKSGGALKKMLPPFQLGVGGKLGSDKQYFSWITLEDLVQAILFAITDERISGPVNFVSPNPVTNLEFTRTLGWVLHRPTIFPTPAFLLRLLFGEMADEALLSSARVYPKRLLEYGYKFSSAQLEPALKQVLK